MVRKLSKQGTFYISLLLCFILHVQDILLNGQDKILLIQYIIWYKHDLILSVQNKILNVQHTIWYIGSWTSKIKKNKLV